jgi:hypothetical protein
MDSLKKNFPAYTTDQLFEKTGKEAKDKFTKELDKLIGIETQKCK